MRSATGSFTRSSATAKSPGIEGDKLTIDFEKAGTKRVVASYVTEAGGSAGAAASAAQDVPF